MEQYTVTGMSCAACSARVEKAVSAVPGVTSCSVSLLTNSMGVEGTASAEAVVSAVQAAGYGASLKGASCAPTAAAQEDALADRETPALKRRLIASLGFLLALMYVSMGHMMWGWPLPACLDGQPRRNGAAPDAADHRRHGHQPEILHQRLPLAPPRRAEYGYARRAGRGRVLWLQHLRPFRHDGRAGARRRGGRHAVYARVLLRIGGDDSGADYRRQNAGSALQGQNDRRAPAA